MKKERIKEYRESRTSWKFFNRLIEEGKVESYQQMTMRICLEILKELQFRNDKS